MIQRKSKKRKFKKIEAGTMADVAFLLLLFFLVATIIETEEGIPITLSPYEVGQPQAVPTNKKVCNVKINAANALMVDQELVSTFLFEGKIQEKAEEARAEGKQMVISLQHDRGTSYAAYIDTYDAIKRSYRMQWNEMAQTEWKRPFHELSKLEQKRLIKQFPLIISEAEPVDLAQAQ